MAGSRFPRDASDDANKALGQAQDDINNFFAKIFGGKCAKQSLIPDLNQCLSPVSECDASQGSGLGAPLASSASCFLEGSCVAASAAAARPSSTASAAAAGGTRATPPPELAEPSFPPQRPSGQHLNIGKIFGTSPGSSDLQEKFIQKV